MGTQTASKLNRLQRDLPEGLVVDAAWLERRGYSSALRSKYAARGWLEQVARGVYRRPTAQLPDPNKKDGRLRWQHVVVSLQTVLGQQLALGAARRLSCKASPTISAPAKCGKSTFMVRNDRRHGSAS